jgi:CBS-domain-containing membrane protein
MTSRTDPAQAAGLTVADAVVRLPKTLPTDISVAQARTAFSDDHVHMLLITANGRLKGTLLRTDLADHLDDTDAALPHSHISGRTISADTPSELARAIMLACGQRRLAAVDEHGFLLGLLCLKRRLNGFCSDADVAARAAETGGSLANSGR